MAIIDLNENFTPRSYQMPIFDAFNRGYKRILAVLPRRCLAGDTQILMANGSYKLLRDIEIGDRILSWNGNTFVEDSVSDKWSTGIKDTVSVRSPGYLPIITSPDHVFAHTNQSSDVVSWDRIQDIGERRTLLHYAGSSSGAVHNLDLASFWGYMLSDGYVAHHQQPKFTNGNKVILDRVAYLATQLFSVTVIWRPKGNGFDLGFSNGTLGGNSSNPVKELFRHESVDVPKYQRRLPASLWNFDEESLLHFFSALISGDGNIYVHQRTFTPAEGRTVTTSVEITISCGVNEEYARDIYWLLRKVGIVSQVPYKEKGKGNWKVKISKGSALKKLFSVRIYGKEEAALSALAVIQSFTHDTKKIKGCFRSKKVIQQNIPQELFDIKTKKYHNFVANGYVVHNSGKDIACLNLMIEQALRKTAIYWYVLPTYSQGRKVIWDGKLIDGRSFLDMIPKDTVVSKNSSEMKITLNNGSIIQVIGSDNVDRLVGANPYGIVFSEYAMADERVFPLLLPILRASDGWAIFISTPRGKNGFYDLWRIAQDNPKYWFSYRMTVEETKHIDITEIQRDIDNGVISADLAKQEYWVSFDMGISGVVYGNTLDRMRLHSQITQVPWDSSKQVNTAWDIGRDTTAICFFQVMGASVHIIDYYEKASENLEHFAAVLKSKPYIYNKHFFPHDMRVTEWAGPKFTRVEKARQLGIKATIVDSVSLEDGIEYTRSALSKIFIDETNCKQLIKCLENYRYEYDERRQVYRQKPLHDYASHGADSLRYLCISLPKTSDAMSSKDVQRIRNEALYGGHNDLPGVFNSHWDNIKT